MTSAWKQKLNVSEEVWGYLDTETSVQSRPKVSTQEIMVENIQIWKLQRQ